MKIPKKTLETLIGFNKEWILDLKKSLDNPIQKLFGTTHIQLKIIELETELEKLKNPKEMNWNRNDYQGKSRKQVENNYKSQFMVLVLAATWILCFTIFKVIKFLINFYS